KSSNNPMIISQWKHVYHQTQPPAISATSTEAVPTSSIFCCTIIYTHHIDLLQSPSRICSYTTMPHEFNVIVDIYLSIADVTNSQSMNISPVSSSPYNTSSNPAMILRCKGSCLIKIVHDAQPTLGAQLHTEE
ncbi:unnamed protein product, partial [Meganyctiphanes norvegica]